MGMGLWGVICFGNALVFYVDWIHFQYSCRQSHVKWTHLRVAFQLALVFISRIFVGFWFVRRFRWLVSVWCIFLLGVISRTYNWIFIKYNAIGVTELLKDLTILTFNFVNNNLRYFLKLFRHFLEIVYCCWNIFISSKLTFQSACKLLSLYFRRTVTWLNY